MLSLQLRGVRLVISIVKFELGNTALHIEEDMKLRLIRTQSTV